MVINPVSGTAGSESTEFTALLAFVVAIAVPILGGVAIVDDEGGLEYLRKGSVEATTGRVAVQTRRALYQRCVRYRTDRRWPWLLHPLAWAVRWR